MKHLIIPTDFSLRSLEPIRAAVTHFAGEPLTITLMHLLEPPADIISGLRVAYRADCRPAVPRAFTLAIDSVAAVYANQIRAIKVNVSYGSTPLAVRNLLEHLRADAILFNPHIPFELPASASIDPRPVLRRAMPRHVVETGAATSTANAPSNAVHERPARVATGHQLQPAAHTAAEAISPSTNFSRHAS